MTHLSRRWHTRRFSAGVLRITQHDNAQATTLKLEGKLLEPWTQSLRDAIEVALAKSRPVQLDLQALEYADLCGAALLRQLVLQGATITSCSGFMSELLERKCSR